MQIILLLLAMFVTKDLSAAEASTSDNSRLLVNQLKQTLAAKAAASAQNTASTPARAISITNAKSSSVDTRSNRKRQAEEVRSALPAQDMTSPQDIFVSDVSNLLLKLSPSTSTESRTRMAHYISETLVPLEPQTVSSSKRIRREGSLVQQNTEKNSGGDQSVASALGRSNRDELLRSDLITLLLQLAPSINETSCERIADHAVSEVARKEKENRADALK